MIQISTRGRYALRAMVDLAQHGHQGPVLRHDLAARQDISADYVAQLFRGLRMAGLVEATKGPGGGYSLARDAALITAADVIEAVEGPLAVVHCAVRGPGEEPACRRAEDCATHLLWQRLSTVMADYLHSVSLQDLCERKL